MPILAQAEGAKSLFDTLLACGPMLYPILAASVLLGLVVLERFFTLRRVNVVPKPFVKCFLSQISEGEVDRAGALEHCLEDDSCVSRVFEAGARRWGKSAVEVEQAVLDEGERCANEMRRYLRVINGVAAVCPLLGLLGTVWGMIEAFEAIAGEDAMGRPELLASGIGSALLSTAAGLVVAIPAMIAYLYFVGRVDSLVMELDRHGQELVNLVSAEALSDAKSAKRKAA
ncbi:Biopolymer transport protein ExbB [Pseudobythopirellula maris]|uniref:Biopolymer transport protein ExbB n=1 Tax=Pseudobythopirellula maris TaxID=2527991 RepID=A0A5C5ZJK1_9BACT|nr:MotA/TolQ/ExbB proton channel family protein [Pseudobythopirellula maris]TWT86623.1 Biopolymer transport protein ExbB [Pseudobythopirellula maris]